MEVIQGKSTDEKVVIAQEIAFAKILAGNNKVLRDKALRKLKRWLTIRGNGKWAFEESEFIRISTGLFYCMWMSDKYLVQEELAESISELIHCFEKNSEGALLFIKCFFKRLLMEWEGLDQYRIDKFNMLVRRFLRQSLVYCKRRLWDKSTLSELTKIFYYVVLHKDNCLGFVLHFISIYAEEIAKVSKGRLQNETVLALVEPIVRLMAKSKEERIQEEVHQFFDHIIRQTDVGLEFEDRFNAWKQQGFPGTGPECMKREIVGKKKNVPVENGKDEDFRIDNDEDEEEDDDDDDERPDEALDPRAGSVDVFLPQIPIDPDALIALLKKYENTPQTIPNGKKKLRTWIHRLYAIKKGRFPAKIKKDLILEQKNKRRSALKEAKKLLEFTESLSDGPVRTKELKGISKVLEGCEEDENEEMTELDEDEELNGVLDEEEEEQEEDEEEDEMNGVDDEEEEEEEEDDDEDDDDEEEEEEDDDDDEDEEDEEEDLEEDNKPSVQVATKTKAGNKTKGKDLKYSEQVSLENKKTKEQQIKPNTKRCFINPYAIDAIVKMQEAGEIVPENILNQMRENKKQLKRAMKNHKKLVQQLAEEAERESKKATEEVKTVVKEEIEPKKKRVKLFTISRKREVENDEGKDSSEDASAMGHGVPEWCDGSQTATPLKRRKILSSWQVQELDTSSPEYYKIKTPKTIKLEKKASEGWDAEENQEPEKTNGNLDDAEPETGSKVKEEFSPVFWDKAKAKAGKKFLKNKDIVVNPYALTNDESKSPGMRRISFALDRNMAQENDEYLEEVRNSPKVPFDGSKKPSQSVLKSGLSPSPVNPFYRFKRIKF